MTGLMLLRASTTPISSATASSLPRTISRVTTSVSKPPPLRPFVLLAIVSSSAGASRRPQARTVSHRHGSPVNAGCTRSQTVTTILPHWALDSM